jgi:hypothetical protein
VPAAPLPGYPQRRVLVVELPERTIGVAEFVELHGCDLGALVGVRNSPLGRTQGASQRLGYEVAWLAAVDGCGADTPAWLTALADGKRQDLSGLFWNATFAGPELRIGLSASGSPASGDLATLLRNLNDMYDQTLAGELDLTGLEETLGQLRQGSWLGPARRDWAAWRGGLDGVADALDEATPGLCRNGQPTPRSRRLNNVFRKLYVEQIQPDLAEQMGRQRAWLDELTRLAARFPAVRPAVFDRWFRAVAAGPDSEWQRTRTAVVAHAEAWQRLFAHCGLEPVPGVAED